MVIVEHTVCQAVGHRLFTMETCFHSRGIPCRIVVDKVAMGRGFSFHVLWFSYVGCHSHAYKYVTLYDNNNIWIFSLFLLSSIFF